MYIVYMHISPSDKRYIGITKTNVNKRWRNGRGYEYNQYFTNAINKYGWDNFQHIIIAKGLDEETAKWLEIELIREWNTTNREYGYNQTLGGEGRNGWIYSEEWKKNRSISMMGENNHIYGEHHTEETKEKISNSRKGKYCGENHHMYGEHHTKETKEKISKNRKGKRCGKNGVNIRPIICITTKRIFLYIKEGAEYYNVNDSHIVKCCKGKIKSCGKLNDGTKLVWKYLVWEHNKRYRIKFNR